METNVLNGVTPQIKERLLKIYNLWLKAIAKVKQRPYNHRKSLDSLDEDNISALLKLQSFFDRNPEIDEWIYFLAGAEYIVESFDGWPDLKMFVSTSRFIKCYKRFIDNRDGLSVESDEVVNDFLEGIRYIVAYLKENGKKFEDYKTLTNEHGIPLYLLHLRTQKILMYHLHLFDINPLEMGDEILNIYVDDFRKRFYETRRQYVFSIRIKQIVEKIKQLKTKK